MNLCTCPHRPPPLEILRRRRHHNGTLTASLSCPSLPYKPSVALSKLVGTFGSSWSKGKRRGCALLCFPDETSTVVSDRSDKAPVKAEEDRFEEVLADGGGDGAGGTTDFLDSTDLKWNTEDTSNILLFGSGALVALWLISAVIDALDSLPLLPKVMEFVGLSFTVWFSARYLIFKSNRDELMGQIESLKELIIGPSDD